MVWLLVVWVTPRGSHPLMSPWGEDSCSLAGPWLWTRGVPENPENTRSMRPELQPSLLPSRTAPSTLGHSLKLLALLCSGAQLLVITPVCCIPLCRLPVYFLSPVCSPADVTLHRSFAALLARQGCGQVVGVGPQRTWPQADLSP